MVILIARVRINRVRLPILLVVNSIIPGRNPPLYYSFTLIAMQGHQTNTKRKHFEDIIK